ncbi:MAG: ATP-binding protein [Planctomycetota bacterium]|nr:ATP-binding protein [Planctomycetota bacterium]
MSDADRSPSGETLDHVAFRMPSHPRYLPLLRALVGESATLVGFDSDLRTRVLLAVTEAVTNVIRHAYGGVLTKPIDLEVRATDESLRLDLIDYGLFIDPKHIASRPLEDVRPGGLGVHLIKTTMDRVEYRENAHGGTTLTMVKLVTQPKESS